MLEKLEKYVLYATVFLLPISFLYISPNPFVVSKLAVLVFGLSIFFIIRSIRIILTGKLEFKSGSFDLPVLVLLVAYFLSALLRSPNKMEALLLPGTTTIVVGGALLYFAVNQLEKTEKKALSLFLVVSGGVFSLLTILAASGLLAKVSALPAFVKSTGFTPEGGYLPSAALLGVLLPIGLGLILSEEGKNKLLAGISSILILVTLGLSIYNLLPGKPFAPRFLTYGESWNIAVDALKQSPIIGMGSGNYLTAFNRFRPISYNASDLWAVKFATARSSVMTMLTEAGLLAGIGIFLVVLAAYKMLAGLVKDKKLTKSEFPESAVKLALGLLLAFLIAAPSTLTLTVVLFVLMALSSNAHVFSVSLVGQKQASEDEDKLSFASRLPAFIVTLPLLAVTLYTDVRATGMLVAENRFKNSIEALANNEASNTYDTMRQAVAGNSRVDRYRVSFSRVNLVLANAVAAKSDITDADRQNITTLVQQAINEAKSAVALNPLRAGNWESLGQVYRAIAPLAKGADDFAIQSYRQAIVLDPVNPQLRVALGGLYFAKGDYENAVRVFELAVAAKPNHANARYNLAVALEQDKKIDRAISEMTVVLSLIENKESKDYEVAKKALEDLQAKKASQPASGDELTAPQKAQEPVLQPPLDLPQGSEPPQAPVSQAPTEAPQPSVTPTPDQ